MRHTMHSAPKPNFIFCPCRDEGHVRHKKRCLGCTPSVLAALSCAVLPTCRSDRLTTIVTLQYTSDWVVAGRFLTCSVPT